MARIIFPEFAKGRGVAYWLRPRNLWASRRKFLRTDHSSEWRKAHIRALGGSELPYLNNDAENSAPFSALLSMRQHSIDSFRFLMMADTGEGDKSQYALVPLIKTLEPDFMLIAGDIVYPIGKTGQTRDDDDYLAGMFEPYSNLNLPIWGVPGNHEYYSPGKGREFFETFCGTVYQDRWQDYGLNLVRQPGSFWELREPGRERDIVVIGIDTGLHGNLDGHNAWWQFWKRKVKPDDEQMGWLHERLHHAQRLNHKVIVLFHIPSLVDQGHKEDVHLRTFHRLIGEFPCVKLVVAGHIHNYQHYTSTEFGKYLREAHEVASEHASPEYIVTGGGGAYLTSTEFKKDNWRCTAYPDAETWASKKSRWRSMVAKSGLDRTFVGRVADVLEQGVEYDADVAELLSLLMVDVIRRGNETWVSVTPVYLDNLENLFRHLPGNEFVDVRETNAKIDPGAVTECLRKPIVL